MAKAFVSSDGRVKTRIKKKTAQGRSSWSRPKTKYQRRTWKKYRGQGR